MAKLITEIKGSRGRSIRIFDNKCEIKTTVTIGSVFSQNATDGTKTVFLCDVTGVQFKRSGITIGYLQFETSSMQMNNMNSNFFSENTFTFEEGKNGVTNEFMEKVYQYIVDRIEEIKYGEKVIEQTPNLYIEQNVVESAKEDLKEEELQTLEVVLDGMSSDLVEFEKEIKNTLTKDLQLILDDQKELFTDEEIKIIEKELLVRNEN